MRKSKSGLGFAMQVLANPRNQASRTEYAMSPRGSDMGMCSPLGSWCSSPILTASALPLTPVGSEGDLRQLACDDSLDQATLRSSTPPTPNLLGEVRGTSWFQIRTEGSVEPCVDGTGDGDHQGSPSALSQTPLQGGDCPDRVFFFPVCCPVERSAESEVETCL